MSSVLSSQGLVVATAMAITTTLIFLVFSRKQPLLMTMTPQKLNSQNSPSTLRSCLSSGDKKKDRKKKKVSFAGNVEEEMVKQVKESRSVVETSCRNQIPENRVALYNGILKDRVQRMECSY